jgi:hypothetical protein
MSSSGTQPQGQQILTVAWIQRLTNDIGSTLDTLAQRIFESHLPPAWVVNGQRSDYGKDYLIETVEAEGLTGKTFYVQLEGQGSVRLTRSGAFATLSLENSKESLLATTAIVLLTCQ